MNGSLRKWLPLALFGLIAALGAAAVAAGFTTQGGGTVRAGSAAPVTSGAPSPGSGEAQIANPASSLPVLAYYYIWFDPTSWDRAKIDYPQLGDYSSDDPNVVRQHVEWAKSAGIQGFIVSWKDTATNDRRLKLLMQIAKQENFKLAMIYQGLDFNRKPLTTDRVAADFRTFHDEYASDPVFYRIGGKTLTIWSGTWDYSHASVAQVTAPVRNSMLVLSTEKSVQGFDRLADVTDGDAYYWSSVNPETNSNYSDKLKAMATAAHKAGKYWIAPFAPGFDARLVGGTGVIDRNGGQTLRAEYAAALSSSPDIMGLISWNEFSENSYIEPSRKYGTFYLDTMRELRSATVPSSPLAQDSNTQAGGTSGYLPNLLRLGGFGLVLVGAIGAVATGRRSRGTPAAPPKSSAADTDFVASARSSD
ncbi:MAG TPA: endo-1,3-alpha-glucanase family glycosylhydrolase [Actinocrinis sp.]|uniref:endo-1,3-alpha-glucanase family glycosylhydrolase n=1 Tax=Actinocrinis sp. TaxID=1920516 RepID=UPI002D5429A2|nr:endo-1,3-alpha-glucanase family glycosylhydrolase [Actinocrinis sp.]HZU58282.1 endo-1,3-alpha-glucanase family glycosylhydrolase [Actinocrinis sp.]